jgi:hypothetical protein
LQNRISAVFPLERHVILAAPEILETQEFTAERRALRFLLFSTSQP